MIGPSQEVAKSIPDIIKAAAASPLGIFALIIIVVGVLAYVYFKTAPVKFRMAVFSLLFLGALLYGIAVTQAAHSENHQPKNPPTITTDLTSIDGVVADAGTGKSIERATVSSSQSPSPAITDSNGIFHLKVKNTSDGGSVVVHVSKDGYQPLDWTVTPPLDGGLRILLTKESASVQASASVVTAEVYRSDNAASGACKDFGAWTTLCSVDKPEGWAIVSQNFALTGDRAGCVYAECELVSPQSPRKVCYRFRTQGHDEECGHSGNTGIHYSQGVLNVVWQHP